MIPFFDISKVQQLQLALIYNQGKLFIPFLDPDELFHCEFWVDISLKQWREVVEAWNIPGHLPLEYDTQRFFDFNDVGLIALSPDEDAILSLLISRLPNTRIHYRVAVDREWITKNAPQLVSTLQQFDVQWQKDNPVYIPHPDLCGFLQGIVQKYVAKLDQS